MTTDPDPTIFTGNREPEGGRDAFGFGPVAERLVGAILTQVEGCSVIGIEGSWGSGKSHLLRILKEHLGEEDVPVVEFSPWLIGTREALLTELFAALEQAVTDVENEEGDATRASISAVGSVAEKLRSYAQRLAPVGELAAAAAAFEVPGAKALSTTVEHIVKAGTKRPDARSLKDLKKDAADGLATIEGRLVVLIDDLDRLEPKEAVEVLRLVQSVADFPRVVYVLCYDRVRLAESVRNVVGVGDGIGYIEKIVQLAMPVPRPQPSDLVRLFTEGLTKLVGYDCVSDDRLVDTIRANVGPRLRTPRAVLRSLDALRLIWPGVAGRVDLDDLVWLQLLRAQNDGLYRWIEEYTAEVALMGAADAPHFGAAERMAGMLSSLFASSGGTSASWVELGSRLPRSDPSKPLGQPEALFRPLDDRRELRNFRDRRLSSSDHSRLYFGFLPPEGAMTPAELEAFVEEATTPDLVVTRMRALATQRSRTGRSRLAVVIDQLATAAVEHLRDDSARGYVTGTLRIADELLLGLRWSDASDFSRTLAATLSRAMRSLPPEASSALLLEALPGSEAIGFLSLQMRTAGPERDGDPLLDDEAVERHIRTRFERLDAAEFIRAPYLDARETVWRRIAPSAHAAFLDEVSQDDALLASYFIERYRPVRGASDAMMINTLVLLPAAREIGGVDRVLGRLRPLRDHDALAGLVPPDDDGEDAAVLLREIVNLLEEASLS